ncbi:MAG: hypothetical protein BKP49_02385 [Treponema sp. CETP13]|nr:MAG: hypothetical protein BKP49_02385 [Treponema sp. CETP13]
MGFSLIFKTDKHNRGILTISFLYRTLFVFMFLVFVATFFMDIFSGHKPVLTSILVLFCIVGLLYRECWVFDSIEKTVSYSIGIVPFVKKTTIPFSNIDSICIVSIKHTKDNIQQMQSQIVTNNGNQLPELETVKPRSASPFTERTKKIAQILEKQIEYITL